MLAYFCLLPTLTVRRSYHSQTTMHCTGTSQTLHVRHRSVRPKRWLVSLHNDGLLALAVQLVLLLVRLLLTVPGRLMLPQLQWRPSVHLLPAHRLQVRLCPL